MRSVLLLLAVLSVPAFAQGTTLPLADRGMPSVAGSSVSPQSVMGSRGLVLVFWSPACPWVDRYQDRLVTLVRGYGSDVGFLLVNPNNAERSADEGLAAMREKAAAYGVPVVQDTDGALARALGAQRTPHVFVFNAQGSLVFQGSIDDSAADPSQVEAHYLRDALEALRAGRAPASATSAAFGCTIKM